MRSLGVVRASSRHASGLGPSFCLLTAESAATVAAAASAAALRIISSASARVIISPLPPCSSCFPMVCPLAQRGTRARFRSRHALVGCAERLEATGHCAAENSVRQAYECVHFVIVAGLVVSAKVADTVKEPGHP